MSVCPKMLPVSDLWQDRWLLTQGITTLSPANQCSINLASLWVDGIHSCSVGGTVQVSLLGVRAAAASAAPADHAAERDARLIGRFISELNRTVAVNCSLRRATHYTFKQVFVLTVCLSCVSLLF